MNTYNRDPGKRQRRPADNDKNWHPDMPEQSSPIKPMPALGCTGKYFRDVEPTRGLSSHDTITGNFALGKSHSTIARRINGQ